MNLEDLRALCLSFPSATADFPFGEETMVFRVGGRIFALCGVRSSPLTVNLKGDPALNRDLRSSYPEVVPGWHMNKEHWNTVTCGGSLPPGFLEGLVRHSYDLVRASLPQSVRTGLG